MGGHFRHFLMRVRQKKGGIAAIPFLSAVIKCCVCFYLKPLHQNFTFPLKKEEYYKWPAYLITLATGFYIPEGFGEWMSTSRYGEYLQVCIICTRKDTPHSSTHMPHTEYLQVCIVCTRKDTPHSSHGVFASMRFCISIYTHYTQMFHTGHNGEYLQVCMCARAKTLHSQIFHTELHTCAHAYARMASICKCALFVHAYSNFQSANVLLATAI